MIFKFGFWLIAAAALACATNGSRPAPGWDSPVQNKAEWNDVGQAPQSVRDFESPIAGPYYVLLSYGRYCQVSADIYYRVQAGDLVRCVWRVLR